MYYFFVNKLCPNCFHLGKGKHRLWSGNIYLAIVEFIAVIIIAIQGVMNGFGIFRLIIGIALLLFGIKNTIEYYNGGNICPICNKKDMLHLDTPKAQALIKEHNLTIPDEAQQQSTIPKTSQ